MTAKEKEPIVRRHRNLPLSLDLRLARAARVSKKSQAALYQRGVARVVAEIEREYGIKKEVSL